MSSRLLCSALFLVVSAGPRLWSQTVTGPGVRFHTNLGDIDVTLLPDAAPQTVTNFLNYVNRGAFNNSIIHRSVPGFIFQGGGYSTPTGTGRPISIPSDPPVVNEYKVSNTRGTLAMAKTDAGPNTATNQWFFNEVDNSQNLDNQNGGFTVFGRVANDASLAIMDQIAAVPVYAATSPFDQIPLVNYKSGTPATSANYVTILSITQLDNTVAPSISSGGIVTASSFGAYPHAAPGSYIEIYGANLAGTTRGWTDADFTNGNAPTVLDGVSVTINTLPAYVNYVSPGQVNVQVPAGVPTDAPVPVVVTYKGQSSDYSLLTSKSTDPGLLAPAAFKVNGKQYVAAVHSATGAFVSNGSIPGFAAAPAVPGETLTFYGLGFGPVAAGGSPIAGQKAQGLSTLVTPVQFIFGSAAAQVTYAGLVPGLVGVDQFNVVVPTAAVSGDQTLQVLLGGVAVPQTLAISVQ